jgi:hypothetical protein
LEAHGQLAFQLGQVLGFGFRHDFRGQGHVYLLGSVLVVDSYEEFERATKRHKPRALKHWSRLNKRDSTMPQEDVPLTPEIMAEAKAQYLAELESKLSVGFQR